MFSTTAELIKFLKTAESPVVAWEHLLGASVTKRPTSRKEYRMRQGHFYKVVVLRDLNVVVKFLKTKEERCKYSLDDADLLFKSSHLKTGVQKFPRRNTFTGEHFLYPLWHSKSRDIIVQDLVDTSSKAVSKAMDYFLADDDFTCAPQSDIHDGNVGMFEGFPVIFDYWHK